MSKKHDKNNWDLPLLHPDHPRPVTRRQLLSQGFLTGAAFTVGGIAPLLRPGNANAALSPDLDALRAPAECNITDGAGNTVNVTVTDVPASNGIIHVIDAVLLPTP